MAAANLLTPFARSLIAPARTLSTIFSRELPVPKKSKFCWRRRTLLSPASGSSSPSLRFFSSSTAMESATIQQYSLKKPKTTHSTVVVEGNIGSGKAQLLNYFLNFPTVEVCEEPIDLWRNKDGMNLLDMMYKDPKANSFVFQQYVLETMLDLHDHGFGKPVSLLERSFYCARYVFIENLKRNGLLTDAEYRKLDLQFQGYINGSKNTKVDLILYIRTDPETAHKRIMQRARAEELSIPVEYLVQLHDRYEEWLCQGRFPIPAPVLVIDGNVSIAEVHEQVRKRQEEILFGWSDAVVDDHWSSNEELPPFTKLAIS